MKKKYWMKIVLVLALLMVAGGVILYNYLGRNLEKLLSEPVRAVDLERMEDGNYKGDFKTFPVSVKVDVTVKDHRLVGISILEHVNGQGKGAESITEDVIEKQSLQVDTVSGATYSSIAILKAIEDALTDQ
jgi:uncharacterized protein with FMN-binding domain